MAKKVSTKKKSVKVKNTIANTNPPVWQEKTIQNGLSEAIMGFTPGGIGTQLSQTDTLFVNNRWYLVSNMRQLLSEIYAEHGIVQTFVDVPVDDAFRGGVEVKTKQLSPEQIEELKAKMDRHDDLNTVAQAAKWNRLYGGAGVLILTDQDAREPLNLDAINENTPLEFRAVDMWELFFDKQSTEGYDVTVQEHQFEYYDYYGIKLHKSRVMRMKGITPPSFIRPRLRGWGLSIIEPIVRPLNQYFKSADLAFEVLDEFKLDIFKIKNLTSTLFSPQGEQAVQKRVALANQQKNYQNALTMDAEDDYLQKQLSFSGLSETMNQIRIQLASELRIPMTKLFGLSSSGFNSGEDDIEVYNAMVESQIRTKVKYDILKMVEVRCKNLFGFIPDDLQIEFKPLRILSSEQEENVKTLKFNRLLQAKQVGEIDTVEFRTACNSDKLLPVQLDASKEMPMAEMMEAPDPQDGDNAQDGDQDEPAQNKPYSISESVQNEFKESDHPRKSDGKFAPKGQGEKGGSEQSGGGKSEGPQSAPRIQKEAVKTKEEKSNLIAPEKAEPQKLKSTIIKQDFFYKTKGADLSPKECIDVSKRMVREVKNVVAPKLRELKEQMTKEGVEIVSTSYRPKTWDSLYEKMKTKWKDKTLDQASDMIGGRIVVKSLADQNKLIQRIANVTGFEPIEHDNFSLSGKNGGYRAQHLLLKTPQGAVLEMQIQTQNQRIAQSFSHPIYKPDEAHGFIKYSPEQLKEAQGYAEAVGSYLAMIDQGKEAGEKPIAPKFMVEDGHEFDWSKANLT